MERVVNSFPIQKIPFSKKTEEWRKSCVDYIIGQSQITNAGSVPSDEEMQTYYDLYNSVYSEKDLKYVTNPFNQDDGFPAMAQDYNIIRPKIDLLIGEETKRPFNFRVCRTSDAAASEMQEKAKQMLLDYIQASIMAQMGPEEQARYEQALASGEIQTPEQIQEYLTKDYKDVAEITAYHSLNYLKQSLNIDHEFVKTWKDGLIAGEEVIYVGIRNGEPCLDRVNPKEFWFDDCEGIEFIHEAPMCCHKMLMSYTQVYDEFYDKLDEPQLNELLEYFGQYGREGKNWLGDKNMVDDWNHIDTKIYSKMPDHNPYGDSDDVVVYHVCWKSFKKIGFVTVINPETGATEEFIVDEYYKETGDEVSVEWDWIIEVWEGYKADEIYFGMQPIEYQYITSKNLNSQRLPYTGVVYSNTNSSPKSLVSIMKPLQYLYITTFYRLELAMARDKGKVPVVDVTQIPKGLGIDTAKWMHYLSALGVAFINPYDEGWDIPGREGGRPASFNGFTTWDLTMGNVIAQYIQLLDKIEAMASELSGVTPQRQGAISSTELVGNVERSVIQSAHITEPLFWMHNQVKKQALLMLLNTAKAAWKDSDKQYLNYIFDDTTRAFVSIADTFANEDFDIFVTDSTKETQAIEQLRALIQPAMQNGASLVDAAEMYTMENLSMIKNRLKELEQERISQQQAMQEQEAQQQQQLIQMQNEVKQQELMLKEAELDLQKYKIDQDNSTKIAVAQLNAYRGSENMDQDGNGIPDPIEIGKQAIEQQRLYSDSMAKQLELNNKAREAENKARIENRKIEQAKQAEQLKATIEREKLALEKKKLEEAKKLQAQKDKAAMDREKLKARTALKNKVAGEGKTKTKK
mgnify:CR=1 FL=1|jgi:hypothetical protein